MSEAAIIVIGNEILSGRTLDRNSNFIAKRCFEIGIKVSTIIVIADIKKKSESCNKLAKLYDHVFITGGMVLLMMMLQRKQLQVHSNEN